MKPHFLPKFPYQLIIWGACTGRQRNPTFSFSQAAFLSPFSSQRIPKAQQREVTPGGALPALYTGVLKQLGTTPHREGGAHIRVSQEALMLACQGQDTGFVSHLSFWAVGHISDAE